MQTLCKVCNHPLTWTDKKANYGRLIKSGLTPEEAKQFAPMHSKCAKLRIKQQKQQQSPPSAEA